MSALVLMIIFLVSGVSLSSYLYCWHDIKRGNPHILSLRQITGIMDRHRLTQLYGDHDRKYHYKLTPQKRAGLMAKRKTYYQCEIATDTFCAISCYHYLMNPVPGLGWFILLVGLCQGINAVYSFHLVRKWWPQIVEEMDRQ